MEIKKEAILDFMKTGASRPLSFKELVDKLQIEKSERDHLKSLLKEMVAEGALVRIRGARYGLPRRMNLVTGRLECHPRGFGFVIPEGDDDAEDVFVNRGAIKGAMHGDTVVVRVERQKEAGKREGSIIRVLERAHKTIVGRVHRSRGLMVVVPSDEKILDEIVIPSPSSSKKEKQPQNGQIVVAEIISWPAKHMGATGRIIEQLGDPEDPDVEIAIIVRKYGLPLKFPDDVTREAERIAPEVQKSELEGREDLRGLTIVTIDGETAKDFDDAVAVERTKDGYKLLVSIADVSHYVKEGTTLDIEAYRRSTSVYFPDRCVPMLPEHLSNGICSLNPKVDRLTMTAEMHFDKEGRPTSKRLYRSVIKSSERLTYTDVKGVLTGSDLKAIEKYSHIEGDLKLMEELAKKLLKARMKDGSIDFDLPEPQIIIDIEGRVEDIVRSERNVAHRLIEEFMLAANRAVAEEFEGTQKPFLYRVHPTPDMESLEDFRQFVAGFGYSLILPKGGKIRPKIFQKVLRECEGSAEEKLINHVMLRAMKRAEYSENNTGHFGLAFEDYGHFTSPIRRYPDLVVHRLIKKQLDKRYGESERKKAAAILPAIAKHTSALERKAMEAEREIVDLKKAQFMADKVGETFSGFISGVTSFGIFVELKEYFIEGLVHITTLTDDYYIFLDKEHTLKGESTGRTFRVGDEVEVVVEDVNIELRRIELLLAEDENEKGRRKSRGRAEKPKDNGKKKTFRSKGAGKGKKKKDTKDKGKRRAASGTKKPAKGEKAAPKKKAAKKKATSAAGARRKRKKPKN